MAHEETHPVQARTDSDLNLRRAGGRASTLVTMRAYEVYREVHGEQKALVTGECRGGFSTGELIAFLYARSFPKAEWRARCDEAFHNLRV